MENFYRLTKKELSFISSTQRPILGSDGKRLSTPVIVMTFKPDNTVSRVYTLKWYKRMVKQNEICTDIYKYEIRSMY